jgi:serine/threonine protein kinase
LASDSDSQLPRWFGDYVLLKRLGKGGMGQVFLARSPGVAGIDRLCVIKTLRSQWTNDREYVARFVDEARVVVQLNHRNICPVFDVGQVHNTYYLAMDLVPGRDVQAVMEACARYQLTLPIDLTLLIVGEILEALDAAHRLRDPETDAPLNLVHRDISPHNALISFDGDVKLIDFGLALSALKQERTEPGVVLGKMAYMAPEHARGDGVDRRADLFAVGVMLY